MDDERLDVVCRLLDAAKSSASALVHSHASMTKCEKEVCLEALKQYLSVAVEAIKGLEQFMIAHEAQKS